MSSEETVITEKPNKALCKMLRNLGVDCGWAGAISVRINIGGQAYFLQIDRLQKLGGN